MDLQLKNAVALVTASTGGIGLSIASFLAGEGATVIINGRTEKTVDKAIDSIKKRSPESKLERLVADNSTREGCHFTIKQFPEVDILINNLGMYEAIGFFEETDELWQSFYETNIMSGVRLCRHYLRSMLALDMGRIIFISSDYALNPLPEMPLYSTTKTTQISLSRNLAELTKGTNVTVNSVLAGATKTDGVVKLIKYLYPDLPYEKAEAKFMNESRPESLIQRLIEPEEIAAFVTFLCSPLSSAINGAALRIDGGSVRSII